MLTMATTTLATGTQTAELDARVILAHVAGCDTEELHLRGEEMLAADQIAKCLMMVNRRAMHEPVQYITNHAEFMSLPFFVDANVLIPRPDTEILVEAVNAEFKTVAATGLDLCTGSGCIAISIAHYCPKVKLTAIDNSTAALAVARKNAVANGIAERIELVQSDMFTAFKQDNTECETDALGAPFDFIACNPPYITAAEMKTLAPNVRNFEPKTALEGGADGLDFYRIIAREAKQYLKPGAPLFLEIGCEQAESVKQLLTEAGFGSMTVLKDLAGLDRVVTALSP